MTRRTAGLASVVCAVWAIGFLTQCQRLSYFNPNFVPVPAPSFSVGSGTYSGPVTVSISDPTPGLTIRYTTDPTATVAQKSLWTTYSGPIAISTYTPTSYSSTNSFTVPATIPIPVAGKPATELRAYAYANPENLSPTTIATYTTSYSSIPSSMIVKLWGGGGGGGADAGNSSTLGSGSGGPGGGGGFAEQTISVTPGESFSLWIGSGGAAATATNCRSSGGGMTAIAAYNGSTYTIDAIAGGGGGGGCGSYGWAGAIGGGGGSGGQGTYGDDGGRAGGGGVGGTQPTNNTPISTPGGPQALSVGSPPGANGFLSSSSIGLGGGGGSGYGGGASGSYEFNTNGNGQQTGGGGGGGGNYGATTINGGSGASNLGPAPANTSDQNHVAGCGAGGNAGTSTVAATAGSGGCAVIIFQ